MKVQTGFSPAHDDDDPYRAICRCPGVPIAREESNSATSPGVPRIVPALAAAEKRGCRSRNACREWMSARVLLRTHTTIAAPMASVSADLFPRREPAPVVETEK